MTDISTQPLKPSTSQKRRDTQLPALLPDAHLRTRDDVAQTLGSDAETGLSQSEAQKRLEQYGPNELTSAPPRSALAILIAQFRSLIVVLLLVAAALAFVLNERLEAVAILIVIILNALIGFATELRAEQAITALQKQSVLNATVIREGIERQIPANAIVPGDLVVLAAGERVPGDGRVVSSVQLQIQESALTGESLPVVKKEAPLATEQGDIALGDRHNMAFMGTVITDGRGIMLTTATGMQTEVGKIGTLIDEAANDDTPLERRLEQLGRTLLVIVAVLCVIIVIAGVLRGEELLHMVEVGISLAIAAVPEGLPAVATMTLAIGVQRMARTRALVRRLPAVETLGSTTVICTDKTGTLTKNEMTVTRVILNDETFEVTGSGYDLDGDFTLQGQAVDPNQHEHLMLAMHIASLCNDAEIENGEHGITVIGDPTEGALIVAGEKAGLAHKQLEAGYKRIDEVPFDSGTKRMVTVHRTPQGNVVAYIKGSPAAVLNSTSQRWTANGAQPITEQECDRILALNDELAADALRVLALGYRELPEGYSKDDLDGDYTYVALVGMIDPLREEAKAAIAECHEAGIRTIMITGDQPATAAEIAGQLGLDRDIHGKRYSTAHARDLEGLDESGWQRIVAETNVFARVAPEHKLRIVEALQKQNEIVAMTGDGVNDAPALRQADIGVAMGIKGTEVAKETADMIISDDNFATIVNAVEQGRIIYSNILRFIHFLFSCNLSEIITVFVAIMIGLPLPLAPLQLLWLNIITDVFPALALALEPSAPNVMKDKPRDPKEALLNRSFAILISWQALLLAAATLAAFTIGMSWYGTGEGLRHAVTIAFMTLALAQIFHAFNARSQRDTVFNKRLFSNRWLWAATGICVLLQIAAVYVPFLQDVLDTVPLNLQDWGVVAGFATAPIVIVELVKLVQRATSKPTAAQSAA
ncbi:MAG: HAD-IC family P-type ATPase [Chloroflexota bacterium]|nr:HAD-IC family P-type ATPase [Chloroflexota bacterium]